MALLSGAPQMSKMKYGLSLIFTSAITLFLLYFSVISDAAELKGIVKDLGRTHSIFFVMYNE